MCPLSQKAAVEDIQDRVEDSLMFLKFGSVAKCYILYRFSSLFYPFSSHIHLSSPIFLIFTTSRSEREKKRQVNAALMGVRKRKEVEMIKELFSHICPPFFIWTPSLGKT